MGNNKLILLHFNIHSIIQNSKQIQLRHLINKHSPDIISLNETWLKPTSQLCIEGYTIIRSDRESRTGGGAALCIRSNIPNIPIKRNLPQRHKERRLRMRPINRVKPAKLSHFLHV